MSLFSQVKLEEPVSVEMDNHMSDKDEGCYDNAEAAFSDDEEDLSSRGGHNSEGAPGGISPQRTRWQERPLCCRAP